MTPLDHYVSPARRARHHGEAVAPAITLAAYLSELNLSGDERKLAEDVAAFRQSLESDGASDLAEAIGAILTSSDDPLDDLDLEDAPQDPDEEMVDERFVAKKFGIESRALADMRRRGSGPPHYFLTGTRVTRYLPSEVAAWLRHRYVPGTIDSTHRRQVQKLRAKSLGILNPELCETPFTRLTAAMRAADERAAAVASTPEAIAAAKEHASNLAVAEAFRTGGSDYERGAAIRAALKGDQS